MQNNFIFRRLSSDPGKEQAGRAAARWKVRQRDLEAPFVRHRHYLFLFHSRALRAEEDGLANTWNHKGECNGWTLDCFLNSLQHTWRKCRGVQRRRGTNIRRRKDGRVGVRWQLRRVAALKKEEEHKA